MFKMGFMTHLDISKHKLWPKKGPGVKLTIWFLTTKSQESTQFPYVQVVCDILLKNYQRGLQLCFRPYLNRGLHAKLWGPKVARIPTLLQTLFQSEVCTRSYGAPKLQESQLCFRPYLNRRSAREVMGPQSCRNPNFALDLIWIGRLHAKLWGPKIAGIPTLAISKLLNLGVPRQNVI
jgi:hypothetical protein